MEQDVRRIEGKTQETALQLQQYQEEPDPWVNSVETHAGVKNNN